MHHDIDFETFAKPGAEEVLLFYTRQQHVTTSSREKLERMLDSAYCVATARREGVLIGLARGVTDGLVGRLAECKLDPSCQGPACVTKTAGRIEHDSSGIAAELARRVIVALEEYGVEKVEVLAYETEVDFCKELGFARAVGWVPMTLPSAFGAAEVAARSTSTHSVPGN